MKKVAAIILSGLIFLLSGCGYTLVGHGSLPRHIETIAIPIFDNITLKPGIEDTITQAITEVYVSGGKVRLVSDVEADALLTGSIRFYKADEPLTYNEQNEIASYRLVVRISAKLFDRKNGEIIWQTENLSEDEAFEGGVDVNSTEQQQNEKEALEQLAKDLAERIFALSTEGF